jgi:predicted lipoprotein with Yx(FWY)xxD motif
MNAIPKKTVIAAGAVAAAALLAGCGGSSNKKAAGKPAASTTPSHSSSNPAAKFSTASISGLGKVVVDGKGRTVYVLTSGSRKNVPCTDATGCTKLWPDLSLPDGMSGATAGNGVKASLLGTKPANGETYATYNGWLLYEYAGDTGPGKANGQGIKSFGGTWYVLNASGNPIKSGGSSGGYSGGGGY